MGTGRRRRAAWRPAQDRRVARRSGVRPGAAASGAGASATIGHSRRSRAQLSIRVRQCGKIAQPSRVQRCARPMMRSWSPRLAHGRWNARARPIKRSHLAVRCAHSRKMRAPAPRARIRFMCRRRPTAWRRARAKGQRRADGRDMGAGPGGRALGGRPVAGQRGKRITRVGHDGRAFSCLRCPGSKQHAGQCAKGGARLPSPCAGNRPR